MHLSQPCPNDVVNDSVIVDDENKGSATGKAGCKSPAIANNVAECLRFGVDPNQNDTKPTVFEEHTAAHTSDSCCRNKKEAESAFFPGFSGHHTKHDTVDNVCRKEKLNQRRMSPSTPTMSVSGILSRFFPEADEMDSCFSQTEHLLGAKQAYDELIDSNTSATVAQSDHIEKGTAVGNAPVRAEVGRKGKKKRIGRRRKLDRNAAAEAEAATAKPRMYAGTSCGKACRHQVGKRLVQAASRVQTTGGKSPASIFLARSGDLKSSNRDLPVRNIAYEFDDFIQ